MGYYTNNKTGYEAPLLRNKGEATLMFADGLGKFADRMRESDQFKQKMDYSNSEALRDQANKDREFAYGKERDTVQDNQWQKGYDLKATDMYFDQDFKTKELAQNQNQFNTNQSNMMKRHNDNLALNYSKENQPDTLDPYKQEYYKEQALARKTNRIKSMQDQFYLSREREDMDDDEIIKAERYINAYGKYPTIRDGKVVIEAETPQVQVKSPEQQANDFAGIEALLKKLEQL